MEQQNYQRILLSGPTIDGVPGLPAALVGLSDESLADLAVALDPCPAEYVGVGYWPVQPAAAVPEGKVAVGRHVEFDAGQPRWVDDLEDAPPPPFPDLTRRQLLLGLLSIDITESMVDAQIDLIVDVEERAYSRIEWKAASTFNRHHPLVDGLAIAFALPSEQVDTLWRWAASL